jgi:predicted DNA-binding ribbon-helix-helix protein
LLKDDEHRDTTVRTFRLNVAWDNILKEEAGNDSITVSQLLNHIVRRYIIAQRFLNHSQSVNIDYKIFSPILEMLNEEEISDFGKLVGASSVREGVTKRGLPLDFDSVNFLIEEVYDRYSGWFKCNTYKNGSEYVFNLRHIYGLKWSLFIDSFMDSMFMTLLDISVSSEVYDDAVIIRMPIRQTR